MEYTYTFEVISEDEDQKIYEIRLLGDGVDLEREGQISIGQDLDKVSANKLLSKFETNHFETLKYNHSTYTAIEAEKEADYQARKTAWEASQ